MSEPKRYYLDDYGVLIEHPQGEYVLHSDYAALLATNERVCQRFAKTQCEANEAEAENAQLKAEVERLRKAGDAMHRAIKVSDPTLDWAIECWNAAKEGKPSV